MQNVVGHFVKFELVNLDRKVLLIILESVPSALNIEQRVVPL